MTGYELHDNSAASQREMLDVPLFEYLCNNCNREFELLVRNSETPACGHCGSNRLAKLFSVPAAHTGGGTRGLPVCERPATRPPCGMGGCGLPECGD